MADCKNFPHQRLAINIEADGLLQVSSRHGSDGPGHFGCRPKQIIDQCVDGAFHLAPGAPREPECDPVPDLTFAAHRLTHSLELLRHALIGGDYLR